MTETTVFQSGNSQAVRLPKEFRFKSKTVEIFRRGNEVVLREKPRTVRELLASLPPLTDEDLASLDTMMAIIKEPQPERERDWAKLFGTEAEPSRRSGSAKRSAAAPKR
jgi:antitoxin VapB